MRIVVLTGAGISAESGLATFRDADGIWQKYDANDVATPEGFERNPALVHEFYNQRRKDLLSPNVKPNAAHLALADLENRFPETLIITQNVDDLHERAGSRNVLHMHGMLFEVRCIRTERVFKWRGDLDVSTACSCCNVPGNLRPNVVWFGEIPLQLDRIFENLDRCDHFISIGTSGQVYPAAGFVEHVRMRGSAVTAELNLEPSLASPLFRVQVYGPATTVVPEYVSKLKL